MSPGLVSLGTITIRQDGVKTEAHGARYAEGEIFSGHFSGRYWSLHPQVSLHPGRAMIRFADGIEAEAILTHVGPDSGRFAKPS